jgi:hypothetical protein
MLKAAKAYRANDVSGFVGGGKKLTSGVSRNAYIISLFEQGLSTNNTCGGAAARYMADQRRA